MPVIVQSILSQAVVVVLDVSYVAWRLGGFHLSRFLRDHLAGQVDGQLVNGNRKELMLGSGDVNLGSFPGCCARNVLHTTASTFHQHFIKAIYNGVGIDTTNNKIPCP